MAKSRGGMFRQPKRGPKGGGMGGGGMSSDMLKQAQELQSQIAQAQDEFKMTTVEATAGGGVLSVEMTGEHKLKAVRVDPEILDPDDFEMVQDLIVAAVNEAVDKLATKQAERMSGLTDGLSLPGLT